MQALVTEIGAPDTAVDTVWAILTWHPVALLVEERGYVEAELTTWLETLLASLFPVAADQSGSLPMSPRSVPISP